MIDGDRHEKINLPGDYGSLCENVVKNIDGSVEIFFGPTKPEGVGGKNWIQTIPGRDFLVCVRLYGSDIEFFDQTWKPDDFVKIR